jgi:hypothetical protein
MGTGRSRLRSLEHRALDDVASFRLRSGKRYYYDHQEAALAMLMYMMDQRGLRAGPERERMPEFVRVVLEEAQDPRAVLETFRNGNPDKMFFDPVDLLTIGDEEPPDDDIPDLSG